MVATPPRRPRVTLQGCQRCGGDLIYDELDDETLCLQCGSRPRPDPLLPYVHPQRGQRGKG